MHVCMLCIHVTILLYYCYHSMHVCDAMHTLLTLLTTSYFCLEVQRMADGALLFSAPVLGTAGIWYIWYICICSYYSTYGHTDIVVRCMDVWLVLARASAAAWGCCIVAIVVARAPRVLLAVSAYSY